MSRRSELGTRRQATYCVRYAGWLVLIAAAGCGDPRDEPDVQSRYLDLFLGEDIEVCGGHLEAQDRFVESAYVLWTGSDPPDDFHRDVHVDDQTPCSNKSTNRDGSCVVNGITAWLSTQVGEYHEVAHLITIAEDGRTAPSLLEGAAEALGPTLPIRTDVSQEHPASLAGERPEDIEYVYAAVWTRFLIDRHGAPAFRAFYRAMAPPDARAFEDFERAFVDIFAEPLDAAWTEFVQEPRCGFNLPYCDVVEATQLPLTAGPFQCDEPDVLGYQGPDEPDLIHGFTPYRILQLHLDEPERVAFAGDFLEFDFAYCGPCSRYSSALRFSRDRAMLPQEGPAEFDLPAGDFAILLRPAGDGPLRLEIRAASE
jgi:hypothetical protein